MLAVWGRVAHRYRWPVLLLSLIPLLPAAWVLRKEPQLEPAVHPPAIEAVRAVELMDRELPGQPPTIGLIFSHPRLTTGDPAFRDAVERALKPLREGKQVTRVRTAWDSNPPEAARISRDSRRTHVTVELKGRAPAFASMTFGGLPPGLYEDIRGQVRSETLEVVAVGVTAMNHDFNEVARGDLRRSELVVLPLVLALLLLVFGSVVAAMLPLLVGVLSVAIGLAGTVLLSTVTPVSAYAANVVSMVGLGVAIDYSLFVVSRFREELPHHPPAEALARTLATTGRAVVFSGLTVGIGLTSMLLLRTDTISSIGVAGMLVVVTAVLYTLTFLPALLAILGPRVNALRMPFVHPERTAHTDGFWHRTAGFVMARPWPIVIPVVIVLVVLGLPLRHIRLGSDDASTLPVTTESRRGGELLRGEFPGADAGLIVIVLRYGEGSPLAPTRVSALYDFSRWVKSQPGVRRVDSIVDLAPGMSRERYQQIAAVPAAFRPPGLDVAFAQLVGAHVSRLIVHTSLPPASDEARALVRTIRSEHPPVDAEVLLTGTTAFDLDFIALVSAAAPAAIVFVVLATYVALFWLLRSVLLPLKAVVMNLLSITASYGALVWIFQEGHLAGLLGFTPAPIEIPIPLIMFCILFGLSMDYEVLLLSRTHEEYLRGGDNARAVAQSLAHTGRLITGAAAIMAGVFFGFGFVSSVTMIKAMGVGMGLAVIVDATIVRALLVPATMRLLGRWNWWAPAALAGRRPAGA
ncbi:MAG TPA: MMPL family transporter [Methylomirabilota bacterium]|nr:MMPL family transporter [Methylomirabilota bacterium]